uniref:Uncharacterized protein n=1 Tax=Rhizophora mucronata TaxID=61149 RepID=A0A2P2IU09_RHIMU
MCSRMGAAQACLSPYWKHLKNWVLMCSKLGFLVQSAFIYKLLVERMKNKMKASMLKWSNRQCCKQLINGAKAVHKTRINHPSSLLGIHKYIAFLKPHFVPTSML